MAKVDYPHWFDSQEAHTAHLAALEAELTMLRARGSDRAKEVEDQIKLNGGTVPAKARARAKADADDEE